MARKWQFIFLVFVLASCLFVAPFAVLSQALSEEVSSVLCKCVIFISGENYYYHKGVAKPIDPSNPLITPYIDEDRTFLPLRIIAESFAAAVTWSEEMQTACVTISDKEVKFTIGERSILVNGQKQDIDVAAQLYEDRTFIPLRALVDALEKYVFYQDDVIIISDSGASLSAFEQSPDLIIAQIKSGNYPFQEDSKPSFEPASIASTDKPAALPTEAPHLEIISNNSSFASIASANIMINSDCSIYEWDYQYIMRRKTVLHSIKDAIAVASGKTNNLYVLHKDGRVLRYHANDATDNYSRKEYPDLKDSIAISAYDAHVLVLKKDGTVWSFGENYFGQLGDGTNTERIDPVQIPNFYDVAAISTGLRFSLAIKKDGSVWLWGQNKEDVFKDDTIISAPQRFDDITDVKRISTSDRNIVVIKKDGTVWGWGDNQFYQLGNGNNKDTTTPVQAKELGSVAHIKIFKGMAFAICTDNSVWTWGDSNQSKWYGRKDQFIKTPVQFRPYPLDVYAYIPEES